MAAPTLTIPAGGVVLVSMTGFFMPPRLLVAPAGTRLPRGVHAVVAVPAAAPGGSGCRGAMRWAVAAAAAPGDDEVMESVICALRIAKHTLQRCIGHTADGAKKLLRFEDIEDW